MANDERETFATTGDDAPHPATAVTPGLAETVDARPAGERPLRTRIGRYKILRKLGAGGMGEVWEASDPELGRGVAIKVLHGSGGLQLSERLRREAQALARLAHPNVVTVYDVGIDDTELYIVMQLVVGVTLDLALAAERRTPAEIVALVAEAGRGLAAAHAAGIVHRDFKPTNVLVGADGAVRVSDFGLSRASEDTSAADSGSHAASLTVSLTSGKTVGTPAYMAPEQFRGGPVTHATDQFAFCVTLWEVLCGERPFAGTTVESIRDAVLAGRRREMPGGVRVPRRILATLERGLAPEPAARFESMTALLDTLAPRRNGTKLAIGGAFIGLTGAAAFAVAALSPSDPCKDVALAASDVWNVGKQIAVRAAFGARDPAPAIAKLDARTDRWRAARIDACQATGARHQPPDILERRNQCLDRSLADEQAAIERLSVPVDAELAERAIQITASGIEPASCGQAGAIIQTPTHSDPSASTLYAELARMEVAVDAGRYRDVLAQRAELDPRVTAAKDPTLDAKWNHVLAQAYTAVADTASAKRAARRAAEAATTIGDDASAAHEWANLAELTARAGEITSGDDLLAMARAAATRSHEVDAAVEVEISRGVIAIKRAAYADAVKICQGAIDTMTREDRAEHALVLEAWTCIHHAQETTKTAHHSAEAVATARKALELSTRLYGPNHPKTLYWIAALSTSLQENGEAEAARPLFERAVTEFTAIYGADSVAMIKLLSERASALTPAGAMSTPEALADIQRAVAIADKVLEPTDAQRGPIYETLAYVERALNHIAAATAAYTRAIAAYEKLDDPLTLARVVFNAGDYLKIQEHCEQAVPMLKRASRLAAETGQKTGIEAASLASLGACLGAAKKWEEAEVALRSAITQQDALGDVMFAAYTRWELADELGKRGKHAEALKIAHEAADQVVGLPPPADVLRKQILEWKY